MCKLHIIKEKNLVATLKDINGNVLGNVNLSISLKNKVYNLTTDNQGQVKLLINLPPNTYTPTIIFNGNEKYYGTTFKVKVVVKKANPKIYASKKAYKSNVKTKKYKITLKNNIGIGMKKVKVTLKVNGKRYKCTTNSLGKATFKLTKLTKKGTYKFVIKYGGNKYYNKISKTVKISVKK